MSPGQRGGIIGGVWLVLLGGVFLLQQAMDPGWAQAWPLFVVMAGLGSAASALIGLVGRRIGPLTVVWALIPRTSDGWASAGYETAEHRADIRVSVGVGSFRIS